MLKSVVNPIPSKIKPIEQENYFFLVFDRDENKKAILSTLKIKNGTCVRCEKCNKACVVNACSITSFGSTSDVDIHVNVYLSNAGELGYCDALEMTVCDNCYISEE